MRKKRTKDRFPELWKVEKIWNDCDCFIFGGGYSVIRQFNLDPKTAPKTREEYKALGDILKPYFKGKRVIGVNNAFMLGDWIDVAFWGDKGQYFNYAPAYNDFTGLKVTCHPYYNNNELPGKNIMYVKRSREKKTGLTGKRKFVVWNANSGSCAINLARHLGAKRVFLLGVDMYTDEESNRTHWHSGHPAKRNTVTARDKKRGKIETIRKPITNAKAPYPKHMRGFPDIAEDAKRLELEIINLNPDSKVEVFPKMKVLDVLGGRIEATEAEDIKRVFLDEKELIINSVVD